MKVKAMIHSLNTLREVTIIDYSSDSNIIAEYNGKKYSTIYNCFSNLFYLDDKYGEIKQG